MSRLGNSIQRVSRGSSRGISYYEQLKNPTPSYGSSIKKNIVNNYQSSTLKSSNKPNYPTTVKSSLREQNANIYTSSYNYTNDRMKQSDPTYGRIVYSNETQSKNEIKDKGSQHFRIRDLANSRKTEKDEQQRIQQQKYQKELAESKRKIEQAKIQKQRQEQLALQKFIKNKQSKQFTKKQSQIDIAMKKLQISEKKQLASMNNSSTTGASDYSSSSLKNNGGSTYSYSTYTNKTIGLVGLSNIGNTCFMNSILQCMFNLPCFNEYFLEGNHLHEMKSSSRVAEAYAKTIKMIRTSTSRSETPSELKNAIGAKKSRFAGYSQQDAQQFLAALLQLLSLDLNRAKNPKYKELTADLTKQNLKQISDDWWNYNKQRQDSVVCDFFSGQVLSRVVCSKCDNQSIAFDNIWDMALNFNNNDGGDIMKMIQNFLRKQTISDDYYCSKCKAFRSCQRKIDFYRLPKILVFQLKRFSYGRFRKVKLNNRVNVETTLDLSSVTKLSNHPSVKNPIYNLVGVVNHSGDIDFGHYTAECKNPINGKWYNFNDSSVHETSIRQDFVSSSPYLLFYAKKDIC